MTMLWALWRWVNTGAGKALGVALTILGALGLAWAKGRSDARSQREAKDAKDYRDERQKIDDEISGIGGTDAERISRLRDIANRRGGSKD